MIVKNHREHTNRYTLYEKKKFSVKLGGRLVALLTTRLYSVNTINALLLYCFSNFLVHDPYSSINSFKFYFNLNKVKLLKTEDCRLTYCWSSGKTEVPGDPSLGQDPGFENPYVHYGALKTLWDKECFYIRYDL